MLDDCSTATAVLGGLYCQGPRNRVVADPPVHSPLHCEVDYLVGSMSLNGSSIPVTHKADEPHSRLLGS